jgi:putative permease
MIALLKEFYRRHFSDPQALILAMLIVLGFIVVTITGTMLMPVFAAIVVAYLLDDVVAILQKYRISRPHAVWFVFLIFLASLLFIIFGLIPLLSTQVSHLVGELPNMLSRGQEALEALPQKYSFISDDQVVEIMNTVRRQLGTFGQGVLSFSVAQIPGLITTIVYLILMPLLVLFFLKDKARILAWVRQFLPNDRRLMHGVWREMDRQIGNYVRGKFWEVLIVGVATGAVLAAMGMNYAILLGALVGVSVLVPYIGAVVVTIPVVLIAFFQWGWSAYFFYLLLAYGIVQALDGVILVPLLFSEVVNLHPIAIIVAVLFFGGMWGFWGVFFAIPLASFVQVLLTAWPRIDVVPE